MYICVCYAVTDATIAEVIESGAASTEAVTRACRAGGDCGACRDAIGSMLDEASDKRHLTSLPSRAPMHCPNRAA